MFNHDLRYCKKATFKCHRKADAFDRTIVEDKWTLFLFRNKDYIQDIQYHWDFDSKKTGWHVNMHLKSNNYKYLYENYHKKGKPNTDVFLWTHGYVHDLFPDSTFQEVWEAWESYMLMRESSV